METEGKTTIDSEAAASAFSENILLSLTHQLTAPWLVVARAAEAGQNQANDNELLNLFKLLQSSSASALQAIESYQMAVQLEHSQIALNFEPVPITGLMYDIAHSLEAYAKTHNCRILLNTKGRLGPVISNKRALSTAILTMGYSFIDASMADTKTADIILDVRPKYGGLVGAGVYGANPDSNFFGVGKAKHRSWRTRQPLKQFSLASGAGILVAETILSSLHSSLQSSRLKNKLGLTAVLTPSRQLNLL